MYVVVVVVGSVVVVGEGGITGPGTVVVVVVQDTLQPVFFTQISWKPAPEAGFADGVKATKPPRSCPSRIFWIAGISCSKAIKAFFLFALI